MGVRGETWRGVEAAAAREGEWGGGGNPHATADRDEAVREVARECEGVARKAGGE